MCEGEVVTWKPFGLEIYLVQNCCSLAILDRDGTDGPVWRS